ncbi:MAG: sialate O-acetylesterase [Panacibacter sp.]
MNINKNILKSLLTIAVFQLVFFVDGIARQNNKTVFAVSNLLQNDMVIQQGKPMKVWGTANAGDEIMVLADWMKTAKIIHAGSKNEWLTEIKVPPAKEGDFEPHTISVIHDHDTITLENILIGEVWLCGGQSNMDMELKPFLPWLQGVINYESEIAKADHQAIRLLDIKTEFKAEPVSTCKGTWKICNPTNAADFSAVAYYFALELLNKLKVPVGLVVSSVGGSSCQIWTSRETLAADPLLKAKYLYPYDTSRASKEPLDSIITFEKVVRPSLFYNAMIYPLKNISIRGFLWYQGESNKEDKEMYTRLNIAMIKNWRNLFQQGDLPFYYVQVAPYNWQQNDSTAFNYAIFREAQQAILKEKNTGIASTMDIGDADDIHPRNKKDVGIRLAENALAKTYGLKNIAYKGPQYNDFKMSNDTCIVSFERESIGAGLTTSDHQMPKHFFVAGADKIFHAAIAKIINNKVRLFSPEVRNPVAVRYAFTNYPITNFCNKNGLPAMPFRTDKWDELPSQNQTAK